MVSERDEEVPSNLTSTHDVFAARTLATSFTIKSKGGILLHSSGTGSGISQAISSTKTSLSFSDRD